jgi:hypothetical protein
MDKVILRWKKEGLNINFEEIESNYEIDQKRLLTLGNLKTDMFIEVGSTKELSEKVYDIASRFFDYWDEEIYFDDLIFNNTKKEYKNLYTKPYVYIYGIE